MARYFFHIRRGQLTILDHCGVELVDIVDATREAARRALEIEANVAVAWSNDAVLVDDGSSTIFEVPLTTLPNGVQIRPLL